MTVEQGYNEHLAKPMLEWGQAQETADPAVLAIHGRAQSPAFMRHTACRLGTTSARFYAPEAAGNTWYPYSFLEPTLRNQPGLDRSLAALDARLDQLEQIGFDSARTVLWGFSQGACLLAHHVLRSPRRLAGMILFTGGYIGSDAMTVPQGGHLHDAPVVLRSVDQDPWVPAYRVQETAELFQRAGARVDLRIDRGVEHVITDEACVAATRLLNSVKR